MRKVKHPSPIQTGLNHGCIGFHRIAGHNEPTPLKISHDMIPAKLHLQCSVLQMHHHPPPATGAGLWKITIVPGEYLQNA